MRLKKISLLVAIIVSFFALQSCSNDEGISSSRVQLKLIDAPGDYIEVNVEIIDIQFNNSEEEAGWKSFESFNGPISVDLTELIAGNSLLLTDEIMPVGMLKQIRLVLSDNNSLLIEGATQTVHLDTPSAQQSGLKLKLETNLEAGFSYTFILDWNVQKSIVKAGNSDKYNLKPVIRVNSEVNSGSISGQVVWNLVDDTLETAVALKDVTVNVYAADGVTYITESLTNENGDFVIHGLDTGAYKIKIEQSGFSTYESIETINVTIGEISEVGIIELVIPEV